MLRQAPHALCPNPPIPPYGAGAEIWAVGFLFRGKQPLNILEVVGLRAPTVVAECRRHSAKSRPSLRMERALRSGRWDSICCGKQPLNILEVVGLRAPTAVAECHRHSAQSRPSPLRMKRALRSGRWDSFSAEKPRRLQSATGTLLRAAESHFGKIKTIRMVFILAEKVGFEPTWRVTANSISSRAVMTTSILHRACLTGAYLFYHAMTENTSVFSEIVIIFISPGMHPADNGLPHSGKA